MSFKADPRSLNALEQEQLRTLQYKQLEKRIGHLFTATDRNSVGGYATIGIDHLQSLWARFGGHPKWQELMSPDQLSLLLSFDERRVFRCAEEDASLLPGFVECVLARLPCLTTCVLSNVELACCHPELFTAPLLCEHPFPELRHLDLRHSSICDADLVALVRIMPRLETCDVRGCFNLTWRGLEEARQVAGAMGHPPLQTRPASEEEKAAEHDWLFALYGHHLNRAEGGIVALWRETRTNEAGCVWEAMLNNAQLNMLLHHDTRETFRMESSLGNDGPLLSYAFENVLSRLPKLEVISLRSMRISLYPEQLRKNPHPFPSLKELYLDMTDIENAHVLAFVRILPNLEVLGLKGCYKVSWRVMELARANGGSKLLVLPESREEKMEADADTLDTVWADSESKEGRAEYNRLQQEFSVVLRAMKADGQGKGPWALWKELGGTHCWRTHLRPSQLTLLLSKNETKVIDFTVDDGARTSTNSQNASSPGSAVGTTSSASRTDHSSAATTSSWSAITDPSSVSSNSLKLDAGEVRAYFSHAVARLPKLEELRLDGCPVWPFMWKLDEDRIDMPFPQLRRVHLRNMTCHAKDLRDLVRHIPTLEKGAEDSAENGVLVDSAYVLYDDYSGSKLRQLCCGKVSVCHPNGTWHPLGDKQ